MFLRTALKVSADATSVNGAASEITSMGFYAYRFIS
jgi:hypothetical protein